MTFLKSSFAVALKNVSMWSGANIVATALGPITTMQGIFTEDAVRWRLKRYHCMIFAGISVLLCHLATQ
jgi:hypothetical protein